MAIYYKFKSAKDYDSITIEGQFISVGTLKERIFETKHLGRGTDFDLMVSNAQTNEEYVDEAAMIPKNTSVLIRRVPGRPRKTIVTEPEEPKVVEEKAEELPPSSMLVGNSSTMRYPEETEWDDFGNDLYAIPEVTPIQPSNPVVDIPPSSKIDEESKIKALIDASALDWNRQTQDVYGAGRGFGRGMGGRMMAGRGFGRGGFERKTPPTGYICHRCKIPGHFIQYCPTNGDPTYDIKRVKPPTGIPKSMLMTTPDGSYALPSGAAAVLKPNEAAFEKEIEGMPSTRPINDLPPELRCPLCKEVMKDAVLTSKCCFRSFCDKCIRDYIISKAMCVCGVTNVLADDLLPNQTLRDTISRILESTTSSTENAGSLVHVPDMESARSIQPKVPSPTLSAASKDERKLRPLNEYTLGAKEGEVASEGKAENVAAHSLERKVAKATDPSEATQYSASAKEPISLENAPVPEETQEKFPGGEQGKKKKKKKTRLPVNAADMQWRTFQDFGAENFSGMPLGSSAFNPYWAGGMPLGMDGYMVPFPGAMPYMGYPPGPFDVPFGGVLPQDPFAGQGYMMPGVPQRDLSDLTLGMGMSQGPIGMGMSQGPPVMSREEFEARKADLRRKRELERLNEREHKDRGGEAGSNVDVPPVKARPVCLLVESSTCFLVYFESDSRGWVNRRERRHGSIIVSSGRALCYLVFIKRGTACRLKIALVLRYQISETLGPFIEFWGMTAGCWRSNRNGCLGAVFGWSEREGKRSPAVIFFLTSNQENRTAGPSLSFSISSTLELSQQTLRFRFAVLYTEITGNIVAIIPRPLQAQSLSSSVGLDLILL